MAHSSLRARLNAIAPAQGAPSPARKSPGLLLRVHAQSAPADLYDLDELALQRMGLEGAWPGIERALFLDTETTGLSGGAGTIAFLIGVGFVKDGVFTVEQYMMRDYADEPVMLAHLAARLREFEVLVSFNGRAFDVPLLQSRYTMCRMLGEWEALAQLDLLQGARRLWKRRIGSCRLSALEEKVLRMGREDDLPGSEAPRRFFSYLKCGDLDLLEDVIVHNRRDILSMGALLAALNEAYAHPERQEHVADLYSMGLALQRRGEREASARCYRLAGRPRPVGNISALRGERYAAEANRAYAVMLRRDGDWARAEEVYLTMARRAQLGAWPLIELAKLYEHRHKDCPKALVMADRALEREHDEAARAAIEARRARLLRKIKNAEE